MDEATVFVSAWMSCGSILNVAHKLGLTCDDIVHTAAVLKRMGVDLPELPILDEQLAELAGLDKASVCR